MNILALDTCSEILDICLKTDNGIHRITRKAGLRHSELLLPGISWLMESIGLAAKDLDLIVCSKGPGSFTGLRIGFSTAKGLGLGADCPIVSVPGLEAWAYPFRYMPHPVLPVIDAKKNRFYGAVFREGKASSAILDVSCEELTGLLCDETRILLAGPDAELFLERTGNDNRFFIAGDFSAGSAQSLVELGYERFQKNGADADAEGPIYIRKSEAEIEREKREKT